ncbi:MAG: hypothetical protein ACXWDO_06690 [Bacteroidia bacterium]
MRGKISTFVAAEKLEKLYFIQEIKRENYFVHCIGKDSKTKENVFKLSEGKGAWLCTETEGKEFIEKHNFQAHLKLVKVSEVLSK